MPIDYSHYPPDRHTIIRPELLARSGNRCEGSPAHPDCRAENGKPHPVTGSRVVLTIAHRNHDLSDNGTPGNRPMLAVWCQRCHLTYDRAHHKATRAKNHAKRKLASQPLLEV